MATNKYVSKIPYSSVTTQMEDDSTLGDKDRYPRSERGVGDDVLVEYDKSKRSTYNSYNYMTGHLEDLALGSEFNLDALEPIIALDSSHIYHKGIAGDNQHEIVDVKIVSGGSGYADGTLSAEEFGTNFKADYSVDSSGAIDSISITNRGAGYSQNPTITISDSGGSGADLEAIVGTYEEEGFIRLHPHIKAGALTDTQLSATAGIDATKIADGSVSNTEFQYLDGVTSGLQSQINGKLRDVVDDTTPQLGGDLDMNGSRITSASDITLDADGDIVLDADGGDVVFKDGGTTIASLYAGCILGYTHLDSTLLTTSFTLGTTYAVPSNKWRTTFTVPPSGNVEITASFYRDSSTSNETVYASLSTSSTYSTYDLGQMYDYGVGYADETDDSYMTVKWVITGLTAGSSETLYIGLRASTGTTYIKYGGTNSNGRKFPPVVIKTTALPETILT